MARPLVIVAAAGITISVVGLSLSSLMSLGRGPPFMFEGPPRHSRPYPWGLYPWTSFLPFSESGKIVAREFTWNGGNVLEIAIPGTVYYQTGPEWHVTAKGPESGVEHLTIDDGRIFFDAPSWSPHTSSVEVRITGPSLETIELNGNGKLILEHITQDSISIAIRGSGSVEGNGAVRNLNLGIVGSGNARLGGLATEDFQTGIVGKGNVDVAPTGDVQVAIVGSGEVRLHAKPKHLSKSIVGRGSVVQLDPGRGS